MNIKTCKQKHMFIGLEDDGQIYSCKYLIWTIPSIDPSILFF